MKKNSFVEGSLIASASLILIKVLGALYVIPYYSIVGETGGALYTYAYTIYSFVLNICTTGIPLAISKIVTEYNTLEMYEAKERTYKTGRKIIVIASSFLFLVTFIFARELALFFKGDAIGGNTIEQIELVIRSISFCLLIVPLTAVKKGYLQGHKYISVTTTSQLIEQIVRISFVLVGAYIAISVLKLDVSIGVAITCIGTFVAGLSAYLYLQFKIKKNIKDFNIPKNGIKDKVTNKTIYNKIIRFSIPLIIVVMASDIYIITDIALINRGLAFVGYSGAQAETVASVISTWGAKICLIVNAIACGLSISLIPNIVSSLVKKDMKIVNNYFTKALGIVLLIGLPLSVFISIFASELYTLFYGYSEYGTIVLRLLPFSVLLSNANLLINTTLQSINKFNIIYLSTFIGLIVNACLDIPLILLCDKVGIFPYYGAIIATIIGVCISIAISLSSLKKDMQFRYKDLFFAIIRTIYSSLIIAIPLFALQSLFKDIFNTRITMIISLGISSLVSVLIYLLIVNKNKLLNDVLGEEQLNKIYKKLKIKSI